MTSGRELERIAIREAVTKASATESIGRKLGDELISASREVIAAWHQYDVAHIRMAAAIVRLERLVGRQ